MHSGKPLLALCPIGKFVFSHEDALRCKTRLQEHLRAWDVDFVDLEGVVEDGLVRDQAHVEPVVRHFRAKGVDALFIGPFDMSCVAGPFGDVEDPVMKDLIARFEGGCRRHGMAMGTPAYGKHSWQRMFERGYQMVSAGSDAIVGATFDYVLAGTDGGNDFDWTQMDVSAVMPAGTASARIQLIHILEASTSDAGAIFLDDASLTVTAP